MTEQGYCLNCGCDRCECLPPPREVGDVVKEILGWLGVVCVIVAVVALGFLLFAASKIAELGGGL